MGKLMEAIQKNETSRKILSTDEGIVEPISVRAWKDRHGKIHMSEYFARQASATHSKCNICGDLYPLSSYTACPSCREKKEIEKYNCMPYREWDGKIPLYSDYANRYFRDADEICDYCYDEEIDASILRLKLCEPVKYRQINEDYWVDDMYEDQEELPDALISKLVEFNEFIEKLPNDAWNESLYRTSYDCTPVTDTIVE
jgi:hypothetical protein